MLIYVRLLNEGTEVFRPTQATEVGDGLFRILATGDYDADSEKWEFPPGAVVRAETRVKSDEAYFLAAPA